MLSSDSLPLPLTVHLFFAARDTCYFYQHSRDFVRIPNRVHFVVCHILLVLVPENDYLNTLMKYDLLCQIKATSVIGSKVGEALGLDSAHF